MKPNRMRRYTAYVAEIVIASLVLVMLPSSGAITGASSSQPANPNLAQQLAVPAYIDPTANPGAWAQLNGSQTGTVGIVVANVDSGPDSLPVPAWASAIHQAHAAGSKVLGYVDTGYLGSPIIGHPNGLLTRSGLTGLQAWLPQAEADINAWYQFYGSDLGGIFLDEGANQCGPTPPSTFYADEYQALSAYVKKSHPGALTALNPGTAVPQCFQNSADVLVTFEGSYGDYTGSPVSPAEAYQPLPWTSVDPNKIWHIVYGASQNQMENVMALSKSRNAGYIYVTNDVPANPYDTLPPAAYWTDEQDESYPFGNPGSSLPSAPTGLTVQGQPQPGRFSSFTVPGSTQVQLSWQPSTGVSAPVVAYDVYQGSTWLGSVGADVDSFTATGLSPSTTYTFSVTARDSAANSSNPSQAVTVTTAAPDPIPPTAPSQLTVAATSFSTATLQWIPSSAPGQSVVGYSISQDGAPILTVPASTTSVTVQGLQPGLATYTFSVQAIGSSGNLSPPSSYVSATTTPLPDDQAISSATIQDNGNGTLTYSADFATPFAFRRVFIATGTTPCWTTGNASPICSDYLIENNQVLRYTGTGTDFTYSVVGAVVPTVTGTDNYSWTIPAADIGTPAGQNALFNGQGYSPMSYTDLVSLGTAPAIANPPYLPTQAAALSQYVQTTVAQAAIPPSGSAAGQPPVTDPLCPSGPDSTWHLSRTDGCMVGSFTVSRSLVDGLLPGTFSLGMTDVVHPSTSGRSWSEQVTMEMQPVSGTVPDYSITLAPTCSNGCANASPIVATLVPGQPVTVGFTWADTGPATDFVNVSTSATLVPQLPVLSLPFTPTPQSATLGWSTPVLRCDSTRGAALAGCVFPQSIPTMSDLSSSSPTVGDYARQVANAEQSQPVHWGLQGAGPPLAFTSNPSIVQANAAACTTGSSHRHSSRSPCEQYPFAFTYQGAAQTTGGSVITASPDEVTAVDTLFGNWEASQHILDGDQFWVQVGP
jgi:chitodextrinase